MSEVRRGVPEKILRPSNDSTIHDNASVEEDSGIEIPDEEGGLQEGLFFGKAAFGNFITRDLAEFQAFMKRELRANNDPRIFADHLYVDEMIKKLKTLFGGNKFSPRQKIAKDLLVEVTRILGEKMQKELNRKVAFYSSTGTPLDFYAGTDAWFEFETPNGPVVATVDATLNRVKLANGHLADVIMGQIESPTEFPQEYQRQIALYARQIAESLQQNVSRETRAIRAATIRTEDGTKKIGVVHSTVFRPPHIGPKGSGTSSETPTQSTSSDQPKKRRVV